MTPTPSCGKRRQSRDPLRGDYLRGPAGAGPGAGRPLPGERRTGGGPPPGVGSPPAGAVGDERSGTHGSGDRDF